MEQINFPPTEQGTPLTAREKIVRQAELGKLIRQGGKRDFTGGPDDIRALATVDVVVVTARGAETPAFIGLRNSLPDNRAWNYVSFIADPERVEVVRNMANGVFNLTANPLGPGKAGGPEQLETSHSGFGKKWTFSESRKAWVPKA